MPLRSLARIRLLCLAAALSFAAVPLSAQTSLSARMRAFLAEIEDEPNTELVAFFPRRGDWTWVQTMHDTRTDQIRGTGIWRFPGTETVRAIGFGGPACKSFDGPRGEFGPFEGRLGMQARMYDGRWRRVRGNRFVPPGESGRSPVFVEWRREDGEWVVSAFGEEDFYAPNLLGRPDDSFARDTAVVPEDAAFAPEDWYEITIHGFRSPQVGAPRPLDRAGLTRVGVLRRVSVYVERGDSADTAEILYLPVSPGRYQAYERPRSTPCD